MGTVRASIIAPCQDAAMADLCNYKDLVTELERVGYRVSDWRVDGQELPEPTLVPELIHYQRWLLAGPVVPLAVLDGDIDYWKIDLYTKTGTITVSERLAASATASEVVAFVGQHVRLLGN
jgi:hypothetical protein